MKLHLFELYLDEQLNRLYPNKIKVNIGDKVTLTCISNYKVMWQFEGEDLPSDIKTHKVSSQNEYNLIIESTTSSHIGTYFCIGFEWGVEFTAEATVQLKGIQCAMFNILSKFICHYEQNY